MFYYYFILFIIIICFIYSSYTCIGCNGISTYCCILSQLGWPVKLRTSSRCPEVLHPALIVLKFRVFHSLIMTRYLWVTLKRVLQFASCMNYGCWTVHSSRANETTAWLINRHCRFFCWQLNLELKIVFQPLTFICFTPPWHSYLI